MKEKNPLKIYRKKADKALVGRLPALTVLVTVEGQPLQTKRHNPRQPPLLEALFAVVALGMIRMLVRDQPEGTPAIVVVLAVSLVVLLFAMVRPWEGRDTDLPAVLSPGYDLSERRDGESHATWIEGDRRRHSNSAVAEIMEVNQLSEDASKDLDLSA